MARDYDRKYSQVGADDIAAFENPYLALGAAILRQSIRDFHSTDILTSIDALLFWVFDAQDWLIMLELIDGTEDDLTLRYLVTANVDRGGVKIPRKYLLTLNRLLRKNGQKSFEDMTWLEARDFETRLTEKLPIFFYKVLEKIKSNGGQNEDNWKDE